MIFSVIASVLTIRHILYTLLEQRVEASLLQEVEEVNRLVAGRNPATGDIFGNDIAAILQFFLSRNVPDDNEYLIAIIDREIYQTSPVAIPNVLHKELESTRYFSNLNRTKQNRLVTSTGTFLYLAQPIAINGEEQQGVFVVANLITNEQQEVDQAVFVAAIVIIVVLFIALFLAWIITGKVLAPLKLLTETARSITDFDQNLSQRIPVKGEDEIAELTMTFNEMLDRLEASFASQRDFINDASHELQTPLTIIQGNLEILSDRPQEQHEILALVNDELNRMSRFVGDLLLLARAERPDFLNVELIDVQKLVEEVYAKAIALANRNWHLEAKASIRIVADRHRLTQVMMNLIRNAVEHTTEDGLIEIGASLVDDCVHFWVRDTGVGINLADQERIFKRFARASASRRRSEGAGLGLSIVKAIAKAHGGSVKLHSYPGVGSTFTVVIPLEPPQEVVSDEPYSHRRR
ncbi:two-component sensor histidine kinase [Gloeocapsopsis sp. AAB1 = 1H9]|uniref:histidine kinase n=2 Tax=Gloeocapsopsis TaxID=693222 RepID=A0A6N8FNS4_9CHRO|nr:two-component sensor histidine kinase [Gloeocapsopsis dulcis AAB1 = 1H9]